MVVEIVHAAAGGAAVEVVRPFVPTGCQKVMAGAIAGNEGI